MSYPHNSPSRLHFSTAKNAKDAKSLSYSGVAGIWAAGSMDWGLGHSLLLFGHVISMEIKI